MKTLHLVSVSLGRQPELAAQILAAAEADDSLLLIGSGLYTLFSDFRWQGRVHALQADCQSCGIRLPSDVIAIDYAEMVSLCEHHENIVTWN
ncbi:MAG TPA: DsrH/TusB family sulfur metabolism protein [Fluviicoccus sp.]|nr:DsrH/TusB family sulfur metabolism protein [Fluviicoccus sp.]